MAAHANGIDPGPEELPTCAHIRTFQYPPRTPRSWLAWADAQGPGRGSEESALVQRMEARAVLGRRSHVFPLLTWQLWLPPQDVLPVRSTPYFAGKHASR